MSSMQMEREPVGALSRMRLFTLSVLNVDHCPKQSVPTPSEETRRSGQGKQLFPCASTWAHLSGPAEMTRGRPDQGGNQNVVFFPVPHYGQPQE